MRLLIYPETLVNSNIYITSKFLQKGLLNHSRYKSVSNPKSSCSKRVSDTRIEIVAIIVAVTARERIQSKTFHKLSTKNDWQPLIVNQMLPFSYYDSASFLKYKNPGHFHKR